MNQEEISRFICQELPRHHLQSMLESIEAAFNKSDRHLKATYQNVPLAGPGPQSHHYMVQEALLGLPGGEGFEVINRTTRPAGGHYALIRAGSLQITTSIVTVDRVPPVREAKFRRDLRVENERLQQQHPDFFAPFVPPFGPNEDSLHALLLPHSAKWTEGDHSSPLGYVIAVPYSDHRSRYHLWAEVGQLWQYYDEEGELPDVAYPTLRDRMRHAESEDQSEEGGSE